MTHKLKIRGQMVSAELFISSHGHLSHLKCKVFQYFLDKQTMKKKKNKMKGGRGIVKKKSFLENQKKHKDKLRRALVDPSLKEDDTRVRFENFSTQVSGIEGSIVYQLAGRGSIQAIHNYIRMRFLSQMISG